MVQVDLSGANCPKSAAASSRRISHAAGGRLRPWTTRTEPPGTTAPISQTARQRAARAIAQRSPLLIRLLGAFFARDLARSFHRVRLLGTLPDVPGPLVLFANHPSWWDVELFAMGGATFFKDRRCFAPIDAVNFERYRFLGRLGAFPVCANSADGAGAFLATAEEVLRKPDGLLLVNVEGRFRDVRVRPVVPMPGVGYLARRVPAATFVPLAIEYVFWSERRPNILMHFGEPISASELAKCAGTAATARLAASLEATMSTLAEAGQSRDPQRFRTLLKGRDGMNFFFDLWRRAKAFATRQTFNAAYRTEP